MREKIIYLFLAAFIFASCGEENAGTGEIVKNEEEKDTNTVAPKNKSKDTVFLAPETKDELVLKGGTKISYIKRGTGKSLSKGTMVSVKYKTFLASGKIVDGSDILGRPLPYFVGINMSVKGWDEVFVHLHVGDVVKVYLPAEKAYGKKGFGTMVPPNTDLNFDIEILEEIQPETTTSGLKYFRLVENKKGVLAKEGQSVEIHYYGWVFDEARLYDSSHFNGTPYKFKVGAGEEIQVWEEMATVMRKGEKYLVVSPSELAYAEKGVPELVPPNSKLVFILEMMNII